MTFCISVVLVLISHLSLLILFICSLSFFLNESIINYIYLFKELVLSFADFFYTFKSLYFFFDTSFYSLWPLFFLF